VIALQLLLSIRAFFKYVPFATWLTFLIFTVAGVGLSYLALRNTRLRVLVSDLRTFWGALSILTVALVVAYPKADALRHERRGSDQDNCIKLFVDNVLALREPYSLSYYGNPCSTGPAELLPYLPVHVSTLYFPLVAVASVGLGYLLLSRLAEPRVAVLLSSTQVSLLFLEMAAAGSDFILIGWLFTWAVVLTEQGLREKQRATLALGVTAYILFAGSRMPFVAVTVASLLILLILFRRRAVVPTATVLVSTAAIYAAAYVAGPSTFSPRHTIGKAVQLVESLDLAGAILVASALAACLAGFVFSAGLRRMTGQSFLAANFLLVWLPLAIAGLGDLVAKNFSLTTWEGVGYMLVTVPALLATVAGWYRVSDVERRPTSTPAQPWSPESAQ
jgi:hypothetical protein